MHITFRNTRFMLQTVLLSTFLAATAVQLICWLYFFSRLAFYKRPKNSTRTEQTVPSTVRAKDEGQPAPADDLPSVSVIVCAHNEAANLRANLDRILNQSYRSFQVLVVLHNSSDESLNVLSSLQHRFKHLKVVECNDPRPGKKIALAMGVREAENEVLLLTDADCVPASDQWISKMVEAMGPDTQIVLGFAPLSGSSGFLNKFARYETVQTAMQYLSFALAGVPYMGVGRNMACRKQLYAQATGLQRHGHLASGDDDLFVNEMATRHNTAVQIDPATFVFSAPKRTWKAYIRQKSRHLTTGKHYKFSHRLLLFALAMSHYLHYVLGGVIVILNFSIIFALLGYTVRMSVVMAFSGVILKRLQQQKLWPWVPALDAFLVLYYIFSTPAILMNSNTQRWN